MTLSTSQQPTLIPISSNEQHFGDGDCLTDNIAIVQDNIQEMEEEGHFDPTYSDRNYEGIIAVFTAIINQMNQQFRNDIFLTT